MEALLPSEVARLVLGYLEDEKCGEAAKCFLEASNHLSEYRILAQRGKKYPTKVNGYSLKEVLEEFCLVHTIVQESLSSMTNQENVEGKMIDSLRFLVRACQPVQVHINLHPQQGQGISLNKSDGLDSISSRPRLKKPAHQGQAIDNIDLTSNAQPQFFQVQTAGTSVLQSTIPNNTDVHLLSQHHIQRQSNIMTTADMQNSQLNQNVNLNIQYSSSNLAGSESHQDTGLISHSEQAGHIELINIPPQNQFPNANRTTYQDLRPPSQLPEQSFILKNSQQQLQFSTAHSNEGTMQTGGFILEPEQMQINFTKPEERNQPFVENVYGSSIEIHGNISQPCPASSGLQDNSDIKRQPRKMLTPIKSQTYMEEKIKDHFLSSQVGIECVTKVAENINKVRNSDVSQALGEGSRDLETFVVDALMQEPCLDQFIEELIQSSGDLFSPTTESIASTDELQDVIVNGVKEKKRVARKKPNKSTRLGDNTNAVSGLGSEVITPSKKPVECVATTQSNIVVSQATTPAKMFDGVSLTPIINRLLHQSTSSPGRDLILDSPLQRLIDLPDSALKTNNQLFQSLEAQPQASDDRISMVYCATKSQLNQYLRQDSHVTLDTFHLSNDKFILPKPVSGAVLPAATSEFSKCLQEPQQNVSKPAKKPRQKRCLTRGGRQSAGQMRSDSQKPSSSVTDLTVGDQQLCGQMQSDSQKPSASVPDLPNTVTLYADGKEASSTISYSSSSDLPILVPDSPDAAIEAQPVDSSNCTGDLEKPSQEQQVERLAEEVIVAPMAEDKGDTSNKEGEDLLLPLNSASIRNTPGLSGLVRRNQKRMSLSTPRRRRSHIRTLDFNTPPKENNQSLRRANTSPKSMSTNALSPQTAGRSTKSCVRESLFKAPGGGARTKSKVKAHLFKSPEYAMAQSSGFKVPFAGVTSTPAEAGSSVPDALEEAGCSAVNSPTPKPSAAWDQVGGVSLILDSDVSPVKPTEPPKKKASAKSWDADLRSLCAGVEPAPPAAARKRKVSGPTQRKATKRSKKCQNEDEDAPSTEKEASNNSHDEAESSKKGHDEKQIVKKGQDEKEALASSHEGIQALDSTHDDICALETTCDEKQGLNKSCDLSSESDNEMARMLEQNLMNASSEVASPLKIASPSKSVTKLSPSKPKALSIDKANPVHSVQETVADKANEDTDCVLKLTSPIASTKVDSPEKISKNLSPSAIPGSDSASTKDSTQNPGSLVSKETCHETDQVPIQSDPAAEQKVNTPVTDPSILLAADKIRLSKATWQESLAFETPVKDNSFAQMVPQTPRFLDPSSQSKEDTPRTKIIKALGNFPAFPAVNCETPTLTAPPTPTIRNATPSVSPLSATYFQPDKSSPARQRVQVLMSSPSVQGDTLESILIQECSRIEADGTMRNLRSTSSSKSAKSEEATSSTTSELNMIEDVADSTKKSSKLNKSDESLSEIQNDTMKGGNLSTPISQSAEELADDTGCARLINYQRKSSVGVMMMASSYSLQKDGGTALSEDTSDLVTLPQETTVAPNQETLNETVQRTSECEIVNPMLSPRSTVSNSSLVVKNNDGTDIEEVPVQIHGLTSPAKKMSKLPSQHVQTPPKMPLLSDQEQSVPETDLSLAVSNLDTLAQCASLVEPSITPVKTKSSKVKAKTPASKKKPASPKTEELVETDDESSNSSYSGSSSDSDSNTSSSSSSEEETPVKENVSPAKQISPTQTRNLRSSEKGQQVAATTEVPDGNETVQSTHPTNEESLGVSKQSPEKARAEDSSEKNMNVLESLGVLKQPQEKHEVKGACEKNMDVLESLGVLKQSPEKAILGDACLKNKDAVESLVVSPEKSRADIACGKNMDLLESLGVSKQSPEKAIVDNLSEKNMNRSGSIGVLPKEARPEASCVELKSLIETKDMGTCEKIAKSRIATNTKNSGLMSELQTKLMRTVKHMKQTPPGQRVTKDSKEKVSALAGNPKPDCSKSEIALGVRGVTKDVDKHHTKEQNPSKELPKKRRSKSENEKVVNNTPPITKRLSASDCASKVSDDDEEFKLHLSGDEKEFTPPKASSEQIDLVEKQIAALHGVDSNPVVVKKDGKPLIIGFQTEKRGGLQSKGPEATPKIVKVAPKSTVSSHTADGVLKALLEKGYGCTLPPPPKQRIQKIVPKANEPEKSEKEIVKHVVESKVKQVPDERRDSSLPRTISSRPTGKSSSVQLDAELSNVAEEEPHEEVINTSLPNSLEFNLTYKGLGNAKPRQDTYVLKPMKFATFETGQPLSLAPTALFTLWENTPKRKRLNQDPRSQRSVESRPENSRSSKTDSSRRTSERWDRTAHLVDRPSNRHDSRSRRNRSPSPRFRRDRHYSDDRSHLRDVRRSQDHRGHPRSDAYSKKYDADSRKRSDSDRPAESSASKLKPVQKEDAEDGELSSSDSDFEPKLNSTRRKMCFPTKSRPAISAVKEVKATADKTPKESRPVMKRSSPSKGRSTSRRASQPIIRHHIILPSPGKEKRASIKSIKENKSTPALSEERISKTSLDEDRSDVDLEDMSFPVLGDDEDEDANENDVKKSEQMPDCEISQSGMVTRRRAPPRSVNAHKAPAAENQTPVQKGKRKLSTSPDLASEDSCQSSLSSLHPESKEVGCSRRSKKVSLSVATKVSKPNEGADMANSYELLKKLDVDKFLSTIHD